MTCIGSIKACLLLESITLIFVGMKLIDDDVVVVVWWIHLEKQKALDFVDGREQST